MDLDTVRRNVILQAEKLQLPYIQMHREEFFTVHNADWLAWSERHGIDPITTECRSCGNVLTTNIPIATKELRGLKTPICDCGNANLPFCFVKCITLGEFFMDSVIENSKRPIYSKNLRLVRLVK